MTINNVNEFVLNLFFILLKFSSATALQLILTHWFGGVYVGLEPWGPMCNAHLAHSVVVACICAVMEYIVSSF